MHQSFVSSERMCQGLPTISQTFESSIKVLDYKMTTGTRPRQLTARHGRPGSEESLWQCNFKPKHRSEASQKTPPHLG